MNQTIEIPVDLYNTFMNRAMRYDLLRKAVAEAIQKYSVSDGLYMDNSVIDHFRLLCPYDFEKRLDEIKLQEKAKEVDAE